MEVVNVNSEFQELIEEGIKMLNSREVGSGNIRWTKWYFTCRDLIATHFGPESKELLNFTLSEGTFPKIEILRVMANKVKSL